MFFLFLLLIKTVSLQQAVLKTQMSYCPLMHQRGQFSDPFVWETKIWDLKLEHGLSVTKPNVLSRAFVES